MNLKIKHDILFVFLLSFLFSIVFSYSHSHAHSYGHASNTLTIDNTYKKEHAANHHLLFPLDQCCGLCGKDQGSSHNHHIHFLIKARTVFEKSMYIIKSTTPLKWLALPETAHFIQAPLLREFLPFSIKKAFHQEYFTSFSGLSPPQV